MATQTIDKKKKRTNDGSGLGTCGHQVVLYNDNHNAFDYVVACLMTVFKHSQSMAEKIAMEAHNKGKSVAEVEELEKAKMHAQMLGSMGLKAEVQSF